MINIPKKIKAIRKSLGLTQKQLAEKIGTKGYNIAKYESGKVIPPATTFMEICGLVNLSTK